MQQKQLMVGLAVGVVVLLAFLGLYQMMARPQSALERMPETLPPAPTGMPDQPLTGPVTPDAAVDAIVSETLMDEASLDEETTAAQAVTDADKGSVSNFDQVYDENEF